MFKKFFQINWHIIRQEALDYIGILVGVSITALGAGLVADPQ